MIKNNLKKGFSLIEITMAAAALSGISLLVLQLNKNAKRTEVESIGNVDFVDFRKETDFLIENINDCTASLVGTTFKGVTITSAPVPIELWSSDQVGQRSRKRFSATDKLLNKRGKVNVEAIEFNMPDYNAGTNFSVGKQSFKGIIVIKTSLTRLGSVKKNANIQKPILLTFETDSSGTSTVKYCGGSSAGTGSILGLSELIGIITGSAGEIKLPLGSFQITLIAKYNYCNDVRALLYLNNAQVGEAPGDGNDIEGCAENTIMVNAALESKGTPVQVKVVPNNDKGPSSIQWIALPN